jgi:two-component system, NtrC family, response regulator AtoC
MTTPTAQIADSVDKPRILIVDDEEGIRIAATRWLSREGYPAAAACDGQEALALLNAQAFDIVLTDVRMPKLDGMGLLDAVRAAGLGCAVIMMSAFGDSEDALRAIRHGAQDYLPKPFKQGELLLIIGKVEERERLRRENLMLRQSFQAEASFENIVARSAVMQEVFRTIRKVSDFKSTVLITGESGTGKELVAKAIHCQSERRDLPFVAINCGAIPEQLLESELFGYAKGAFTDAQRAKPGLFEEAHRGTLFLDEVGELPLPLQVKLLRALQEGEIRRIGETQSRAVDVRIIAAGIDDLATLVEQGDFREDLYYRLNVIPLALPPLRDRREDVPLLAEHFLHRHNARLGTRVRGFSAEVMQALCDYHWPGNVRQLQNIIERALVLCEQDVIRVEDLPPKLVAGAPSTDLLAGIPLLADGDLSIKRATDRIERHLIAAALKKTNGNRTQASKLLEISHRALLYKIKDYALQDVR